MRYLLSALVLVLLVVNVTDPAPTQHIAPSSPTVSTDPDVPVRAWTAVSCDENDRAFAVEPDTDAARREAQDWCTRSGKAIEELPWPEGFKPTTLPRAGA
jgi:hypothetical protein